METWDPAAGDSDYLAEKANLKFFQVSRLITSVGAVVGACMHYVAY